MNEYIPSYECIEIGYTSDDIIHQWNKKGNIRKTQCPECGSDEIDVEGFRTVGTESFDVFICNNCGQVWDDSGIDDFD